MYAAEDVSPQKGKPRWLVDKDTLAPTRLPFRDNEAGGQELLLPDGAVHQFLLPTPGWAAVTRAGGDAKKLLGQLAGDGVEQLKEWKKGILQKPERKYTQAGTPRIDRKTGDEAASQYTRLRDAARRAEFLWKLVVKRMELSEREIARSIDVWEADPKDEEFAFLRRAENGGATRLSKEKVYADLFNAVDTPYWRLKQVMDAWCALWFWPVDKVGLLDGTDGEYAAESVDVEELLGGFGEPQTPQVAEEEARPRSEPVPAPATRKPAPRFAQAGLLFQMAGDQPSLDDAHMEAEGDYFYEVQKAGSVPKQRKKPTGPAPKRRRPVIPLKDLDDWLDFLESMLGVGPVPEGSIGSDLDNLKDLGEYEKLLLDEMWMDRTDPEARYPWMGVVREIAEEQGFLHWELDFALAFAKGGGFDLQVGNPPWFRPKWDEPSVLAEREPWFELEERASPSMKIMRRDEVLKGSVAAAYVLEELTDNVGQVAFFGASQVYPLLEGTQPDLYRAFMCQVWDHASATGTIGFLHLDTHFTGEKEGKLREAAYRRLRIHGDFVNSGQRFFPRPVGDATHFGVHVYGRPKEIGFDHLSWLVSVDALRFSADHDGAGEVPGVRYRNKEFDERPHRARVVWVDREQLAVWQRLLDDEGRQPIEQARLLFPVSTEEASAIVALADYPVRVGSFGPQTSPGYHESGAKRDNLIDYNRPDPESGAEYQPQEWRHVILKGTQLSVATPIFKRHDANSNDAYGVDLTGLPDDFVPDTAYVRAEGRTAEFLAAQDQWLDHQELSRLRASDEEIRAVKERLAKQRKCLPREIPYEPVDEIFVARAMQPYTSFYRLAWRKMIAPNTERALYAALIPPGVSHVDGVHSLTMPDPRLTTLVAGFWAGLPLDYFLRATGRGDLRGAGARAMPTPVVKHPLASALLLRTLRLNCLTTAYAPIWAELYDPTWHAYEPWAVKWSGLEPLEAVTPTWERSTPLRSERARRSALVEIDALVAVWLGMDADALIAAYRGRFPVLQKYEAASWFDAEGWKLASNARTIGQRQTKETWKQFEAYMADPAFAAHQADPANNPAPQTPVPDGYTAPFYKADRETEMREAHAYFQKRLDEAVAAGKWDPAKQEVPKP
ncbi:hypothetical protein ACFW6K_23535 [Streptomyces sp. NPDC058733]|uniref:hypothetical protein n=1 Tax=Streptomyces sp. NPDC058733 TaxID=3346614 RepID=UPI00369B54F2